MKHSATFGIVIGILLLFVFIDWNGQKPEIEGCSETDYVKVTSEYFITYCKDNGKVWVDSTWQEPTNFERRWIETK